jgi:glycosyltransferase involved in cell wall biosynthesis
MRKPLSMVLCTNFASHHTMPLASELARRLGPDRFRMAVFEDVSDERLAIGWNSHGECPWMAGPPKNHEEKEELIRLLTDADVVAGWCPEEIMKKRIATGKLTLYGSERILKKPYHELRMINPRYAKGIRGFREMVNYPNVHALAVGHYAPGDLKKIQAFDDRVWRWGYFVEVPEALPPARPAGPARIFWAGRFLKLKRVDTIFRALARISALSSWSECVIVGDGPEKKRLHALAARLGLDSSRLKFLPPKKFDEVRELMRESDIYVLSSTQLEGWGAVAGEAMAEGCLLIANEKAGSSKVLVKHGVTGLLYRDGNDRDLAAQLTRALEDPAFRLQTRERAWRTMQALWHPRIAAKRLIALSEGLLGIAPMPNYTEGPCARASAN